MEVEGRRDDLLAAGISAADLGDKISKLYRFQPVGRIERPPFAWQIIVNTQSQAAREIQDLVVTTKNNQPLHVRDVADVRIAHPDRVLSIAYEGRDACVTTACPPLAVTTFNLPLN